MNTSPLVLRVLRVRDLRPVDADGRRLAATAAELRPCECCGRLVARISELEGGYSVGSECAGYLSSTLYRLGRVNRKAEALLAAAASR